MSEVPLIELRGLSKTYGVGDAAFQALKGVDLTIHRRVRGDHGAERIRQVDLDERVRLSRYADDRQLSV